MRIPNPLPWLTNRNPPSLFRNPRSNNISDFLRIIRSLGNQEPLMRVQWIRERTEGCESEVFDVYPYCFSRYYLFLRVYILMDDG